MFSSGWAEEMPSADEKTVPFRDSRRCDDRHWQWRNGLFPPHFRRTAESCGMGLQFFSIIDKVASMASME